MNQKDEFTVNCNCSGKKKNAIHVEMITSTFKLSMIFIDLNID